MSNELELELTVDSGIENHAYHDGMDAEGQPMSAGMYVMRDGSDEELVVRVIEDQQTGDLSFILDIDGQPVNQRVDQVAKSVEFWRLISD